MDSNPNPNYSRHFDFYISEGGVGGLLVVFTIILVISVLLRVKCLAQSLPNVGVAKFSNYFWKVISKSLLPIHTRVALVFC